MQCLAIVTLGPRTHILYEVASYHLSELLDGTVPDFLLPTGRPSTDTILREICRVASALDFLHNGIDAHGVKYVCSHNRLSLHRIVVVQNAEVVTSSESVNWQLTGFEHAIVQAAKPPASSRNWGSRTLDSLRTGAGEVASSTASEPDWAKIPIPPQLVLQPFQAPEYQAPEYQAPEARPMPAADIWAFGFILAKLLVYMSEGPDAVQGLDSMIESAWLDPDTISTTRYTGVTAPVRTKEITVAEIRKINLNERWLDGLRHLVVDVLIESSPPQPSSTQVVERLNGIRAEYLARNLPRRFSCDDYTIACLCPMGVELAAVEGMLDEIHESHLGNRDETIYTLGRMGVHNIVVAVMPEIGNNRAAVAATLLLNDFPSVRFGLLVGIGGGIPGEEDDIRLGDVVVSKPTSTFGGVVQYNMGMATEGWLFQRTGVLSKPPVVLSARLQWLQAQHARLESQIPRLLSEMLQRYPKMAHYVYQGADNDLLFESTYPHHQGRSCENCDRTRLVDRDARPNTEPQIHYGTIGSGNMVIKDAVKRDQLRNDLGVLCVEMEAAGLMNEFPCLVICGICDYADSHKNRRWQPYAAATAAAHAKDLLSVIPAQEVIAVPKAGGSLQGRSEGPVHLTIQLNC
jgi:nucleoside phosphorylase